MRKLFLMAFLMTVAAFEAKAADVYSCGNNCTYTIVGDTLKISGPTEKDENGNYLTSGEIRGNLFFDNDTMTSSFPENVKNLEITGNITSIGFRAFRMAPNLENVSISNSVTSIAAGAFENGTPLKNVTFEENSQLKTLEWGAFAGANNLENFDIPDGVETLSEFVFEYVNANLIIPDSVTTVNPVAFYGVTGTVYCAKPQAGTTSACEDKSIQNLRYYTKDENTGIYEVDGLYYADGNLLKNNTACTDAQSCRDIVDAKNDGQYCDSYEGCKTLVDMKNNGEYCDSIASCKALSDMAASGEYCDSLESCKALSDMAASGEYCSTVEECKALNDMVGGENCDSLASCKALSDMAASGEYCTTIAECKRFMDLMNSGYCEGFEACKEMFNASVINYDGKRYGSLEDLYNGNALPSITRQEQGDGSFAVYKDGVFVGYKGKRIYTMEEANRVTKPTGNVFKIKYR